jgi:hypothetical protein
MFAVRRGKRRVDSLTALRITLYGSGGFDRLVPACDSVCTYGPHELRACPSRKGH